MPTSPVHQPVPGLQLDQQKLILKNAFIRIISLSPVCLLSVHPASSPVVLRALPKITFSVGMVLGINKMGYAEARMKIHNRVILNQEIFLQKKEIPVVR